MNEYKSEEIIIKLLEHLYTFENFDSFTVSERREYGAKLQQQIDACAQNNTYDLLKKEILVDLRDNILMNLPSLQTKEYRGA